MLFNIKVETKPAAPAVSLPGVTDGRAAAAAPTLSTPGLDAPAKPASLRYTAPSETGEAATKVERQAAAEPANRAERRTKKKNK